MKIYFWHTKRFEYINEIYEAIINSKFYQENEIVLPHKDSNLAFNSKEYLKSCDLMIAEISYPSLSLGIEMWWANLYWCKIICIYKKWTKVSKSLETVSDTFLEYENIEEIIEIIEKYI